jgi:molecular chaperone HscC
MPAVVETVTRLLGKPPQHRLDPDEVVALGAAVQAGLLDRHESLEDMVVTDVAPFTLGISVSKKLGLDYRSGYFLPIINRNTTIPISRVETVSTIYPNQTELTVRVYQGESRRVEGNLLLAEFTVKGIPRGPAGQDVQVRFTYDLNGVLEVEATVVATGEKVTRVITQHARGLSPAQIAQAVRDMEKLKTHPREEAANRFLVRRAERVYQELPLAERETLEDLLMGFEQALEMQEPEVIERHREALYLFLAVHDTNWTEDEEGEEPDEDA